MVCCCLPRQPLPVGVLGRTEGDGRVFRHAQSEHALGVATHLRVVAPAPSGVNVVHVFELPVFQPTLGVQSIDARFFFHLAHGGGGPAFVQAVFAARDGLPGASVSAPNQQDLATGCVDHHQHGLGNFVKL